MKKLRPLGDRVLVKRIEEKEVKKGSIIIPDTAKEKPLTGKVIATGPGKLLDNGKRAQMAVKKNDDVIYGKYAGTEVELDGKKYFILRESDVLGIIEG